MNSSLKKNTRAWFRPGTLWACRRIDSTLTWNRFAAITCEKNRVSVWMTANWPNKLQISSSICLTRRSLASCYDTWFLNAIPTLTSSASSFNTQTRALTLLHWLDARSTSVKTIATWVKRNSTTQLWMALMKGFSQKTKTTSALSIWATFWRRNLLVCASRFA